MNDQQLFLFSLSIGIPAIIGVIRYRVMDPAYHPFVYYAVIGLLTEIVVYFLVERKLYVTVTTIYNAASLVELFCFVWLFHNWGLFKFSRNRLYLVLIGAFVFFVCTMPLRGFAKANMLAKIVNSLVLIVFSITVFNKIVINERKNVFTNPKFWICIGVIIYYTYFVLVNTQKLSFFDIHLSEAFENKVFLINTYSNVLVNLLYAVAVIWVPRKKNILTPW